VYSFTSSFALFEKEKNCELQAILAAMRPAECYSIM